MAAGEAAALQGTWAPRGLRTLLRSGRLACRLWSLSRADGHGPGPHIHPQPAPLSPGCDMSFWVPGRGAACTAGLWRSWAVQCMACSAAPAGVRASVSPSVHGCGDCPEPAHSKSPQSQRCPQALLAALLAVRLGRWNPSPVSPCFPAGPLLSLKAPQDTWPDSFPLTVPPPTPPPPAETPTACGLVYF